MKVWFLRCHMELGRIFFAIGSQKILPNGTPKTFMAHNNWPQNMDAQNSQFCSNPQFLQIFLFKSTWLVTTIDPQNMASHNNFFKFLLPSRAYPFFHMLLSPSSSFVSYFYSTKRRYKALSAVRQGAPSNSHWAWSGLPLWSMTMMRIDIFHGFITHYPPWN